MKENCILKLGDCLVELKKIEKNSVDMIFADPPYFLSNDGFSVKSGKRVSVNKGTWDKSKGFKENLKFTKKWLKLCKEILKKNGSIWVSGTLHNIYSVGFLLEELEFKIMNDITWFKPNGPPHLACRYFAHAHETILWAKKDKKAKHKFNYELMKKWDDEKDILKNKDKQMRSVWSIPLTSKKEKIHGKHPTQKPEELLKRIILSSTKKGDLVIDPFMGSGTTGVISIQNNRKFYGIERDEKYFEIAKTRINNSNPLADWLK